MIIWWLFSIIWWLFGDYLVIIWWLFDDYSILIIWLITLSACSALLKPKCQKMSSTRCNIFSLKRKRFVKFCPFVSTHLEKIASRHAGHGQHQERRYLHFDSCFQKFVHLCLIGGMPDWHSKDWGKIRADCHVKSVKEEITKHWRARLHPVLCCPFGRKKVNSTAMLRVLGKLPSRIRKWEMA